MYSYGFRSCAVICYTLFHCFYISNRLKTTRYVNYWIEIKIGNKFELTDELITINNGNEFVNNNNEIYPPELYFLKSPTSPTENVVLDFHFLKIRFKFKYLYIIKEIPTTSTFHIALFHQIFFFVNICAEILQIC